MYTYPEFPNVCSSWMIEVSSCQLLIHINLLFPFRSYWATARAAYKPKIYCSNDSLRGRRFTQSFVVLLQRAEGSNKLSSIALDICSYIPVLSDRNMRAMHVAGQNYTGLWRLQGNFNDRSIWSISIIQLCPLCVLGNIAHVGLTNGDMLL